MTVSDFSQRPSALVLSKIVERQSENVVLQEEAPVEWFQHECLSVGVRLVIIGLQQSKRKLVALLISALEFLVTQARA